METIYKYPVSVMARFSLIIPDKALFLSVQIQNDKPYLWALIHTDEPSKQYNFRVIGTGYEMSETGHLTHLGTFQMEGGKFVGHLFWEQEE